MIPSAKAGSPRPIARRRIPDPEPALWHFPKGRPGQPLASPLETRFWTFAVAARRTVGPLAADSGGLCRHYAQLPHGARPGVLVCPARPAQRSASRAIIPMQSDHQRPLAPHLVPDGRCHYAQAGTDRQLHRLLCLDRPRHECGQALPAGQSPPAQLQICADRLSRPGVVDRA